MQAKINDLTVNYEVYGQGARLLLLHGWGVDLHTFDRVLPALSQKFQVLAPDLPGFGSSSGLNGPWGVDDFAQIIKKFLDGLEIKEVNVLGHSFGGSIALALTRLHPETQKLILVDSAGIRKKSFLIWVRGYLAGTVKKTLPLPNFYLESLAKAIGSTDYRHAGPLKDTFVRVVNQDLTPLLSQIQTETLIVWGENDTVTPLNEARTLNQLITNSRLVLLDDCGHFPHLEKPEEFVELVVDFLLSTYNSDPGPV